MIFASSGARALEAAEEAPFDVIVSDMRMPGMDGAELLKRMHDAHPESARFVLSGHAELESVMRAVSITHQFLSKPCDCETLREVVTRALELQSLLEDEATQRVVGRMKSLPSLPETYSAVVKALAEPEIDVPAVAAIVERDAFGMAFTAGVLHDMSFSALTAVHVASALVASRSGEASGPCEEVDVSYLESLGVSDRLEDWEAMVDEDLAESDNEARA